MTNNLVIFFILFSQISDSKKVHQVYFNPGFESAFDFFELIPELQKYPSYIKHCVQHSCKTAVLFNCKSISSRTSSFFVSKIADEGQYTIMIKSGDSGFVFPEILNVTANYLCMVQPKDYLSRELPQEYTSNRTAVVLCPVLSIPSPTVDWIRKQGNNVTNIRSDNKKYIISTLGHLFILNFTKSDAGSYSCRANNVCGKRCSTDSVCSQTPIQSPYVKLKFKATDQEEQGRQMVKYYFLNPKTTPCWVDDCFKYTPKQSTAFMYVEPNTDIKVEVFADVDRNSSYVGAKMHILESSPRFVSYSDSECLGQLHNYTYRDVLLNAVECGAYNSFEMMSFNVARYKIAVMETPNITFTQTQDVQFDADFSIEFAITNGNQDSLHLPVNITEWECFKNGEVFEMEKGWHKQCTLNKDTNILTIRVLCAAETDTGYYQVAVKTWVGRTVSVPAYIDTIPNSVINRNSCYPLRVLVLSSTSVRVSWDSPTINPSLIYSIVLENLAWEEASVPVETSTLFYVIENLHPGTHYSVYVQSNANLVGQKTHFHTHEGVPSNPGNLICSPLNESTSIYCEWATIAPRNANGEIRHYKVGYKYTGEWKYTISLFKYINLQNLEPCSEYIVKVMGCTTAGCGTGTRVTVTNKEDRPQYRPRLRFKKPDVFTIIIGWTRPPGAFRNIFYRVRCSEKKSGKTVFLEESYPDVDAVISGKKLRSGTEYYVVITPHNSQGFGPELTTEVSTLSGDQKPRLSLIFSFILVCWIFEF